jgi:aminoglycoside phosphotransferase (APT) family kinase protein
MAGEARVMEFLAGQGFPVPAVDSLSDDGTDLVMERLDGPPLMGALERRPWTLARAAGMLADLHRRLHEIAAPDWLPPAPAGTGDRVLHLDLHPLNVIVSSRGPVVIDWTAASRGAPEADVALTWTLMACASIPGGHLRAAALGRFRSLFVRKFLSNFDLGPVTAVLGDVVEWKAHDRNMSPRETAAMRRLAAGRSA